jgi:hypothetical protein
MNEPIEVEAQFDRDGTPRPIAFFWRGRRYLITSLGRRWEHEGAQHVLVMAPEGQVYELAYQQSESAWRLLRAPGDFGGKPEPI